MELVRGQVVQSRAGRDVGRMYVVLAVQGDVRGGRQRVLAANGEKWTLAAPKAKNPRHLQPVNTVLPESALCDDAQTKAALEALCACRGTRQQGG